MRSGELSLPPSGWAGEREEFGAYYAFTRPNLNSVIPYMKKEKWTAKQMIDAIKKTDGMVYVAAKLLGCDPNTVYNYAKRYRSVKDAIDNQRGHFLDECEKALKKAVLAGEAWAVCFALKTLGKDRGYLEKQQIEQQGELILKVQYGDDGSKDSHN